MKKKLLTILCMAILCISSLVACGKSSDEKKDNDETKAQVEVTPFVEKMSLNYKGATVRIGDSFDEVSSKLGKQAAPSTQVVSCIAATNVTQYTYPDFKIEVNDAGIIYSIEILKNEYSGSEAPSICDVKLGTSADDIEKLCGKENSDYADSSLYSYAEGTFVAQFSLKDKKVYDLWIYDTQYVK